MKFLRSYAEENPVWFMGWIHLPLFHIILMPPLMS